MHFKETETLREEMVGWVYQDRSGNSATVLNVVAAGSGHQVHFNYGADYNVYCSLGKFRKRYLYRIKTAHA